MAHQSTRELVLARRKAMSTSGKASLPGGAAQPSANTRPDRATAASAPAVSSPRPAAPVMRAYNTAAIGNVSVARLASLDRRKAMSSGGKKAIQAKDRTRTAESGGKAEASAPVAAASAPQAGAATGEKKGCGCGCDGTRAECKTRINSTTATTKTKSHHSINYTQTNKIDLSS